MLGKIFGWWDGATLGALFDIGRRARFIGADEGGNKYYEERKPSLDGRPRRYVIYNGYAEPSRISADWHGWMHHTFEHPPTDAKGELKRRSFEKNHVPNMTGTKFAYKPKGSLGAGGERERVAADYEAWTPRD